MEEIILIDKPKGITSFDVIRALRKKLGIKKMGHAGTLDPLASGLLIIGVEKGTKKLEEYLGLPKTYVMEVLLGKRTETGDLEGKVLEEKEVGEINLPQVKKVLEEMVGEIELVLPIYSAIKVKGQPLYKYARKGIEIEPPKRKTKIFKLNLLNNFQDEKFWVLEIEMDSEKGTYARSVGEEIGRRLGLPATLRNLRRTKIGSFDVSEAKKLEEF